MRGRAALLFPLLTLLAGCSQLTRLGARFVDGRLAFVAEGTDVSCVQAIAVIEARSGRVMWELKRTGSPPRCLAATPIFYGTGPGGPGATLVAGVEYEIDGVASGGNYLHGRFVIAPVRGYRLRDLPDPTLTNGMGEAVDNAN